MSNCPARAGFTSATNGCAVRTRDHPRSRGVYVHGVLTAGGSNGSSPLARGLHFRRCRTGRLHGIIPARAGFTWMCACRSSTRTDHPRSRGVYSTAAFWAAAASGSSPLARGLRQPDPQQEQGAGIIPARAGFTPSTGGGSPRSRDHPRSRGVYITQPRNASARRGSSPLARGLPKSPPDRQARVRIIPARAGFTRPVAGSM